MKQRKKDSREGSSGDQKPPLAKTVRSASGKLVKRYPSKLGYHGTDEEKELNPEE